MVTTRIRALALALVLIASAALASAAPYIEGNSAGRAYVGATFDSLVIPVNRSRGIYLIQPPAGGVRSNIDSTLNLWFNGGDTPRLRRMQFLILWNNDAGSLGGAQAKNCFDLTIYRADGTSRNRFCIDTFVQALHLPIEADSIRITSRTTPDISLSYIIW